MISQLSGISLREERIFDFENICCRIMRQIHFSIQKFSGTVLKKLKGAVMHGWLG